MVKKKQVHKSNSNSALKPLLIMTSDSDVKVDVRKNFVNHWIFSDCDLEFIVENVNQWDPHPMNITNSITVRKTY